MIQQRNFFLVSILICLSSCGFDPPDEVAIALDELPETLDFNLHIKPILSDRCFACHGPDQAKRKAGLRLDIAESALAPLPEHPGLRAIQPGRPGGSEVIHRILSEDPEITMPPPESELSLTAREKALLVRWVEEGAAYKPHWAFLPPEKPSVPSVVHQSHVQNPIDAFVIRKVERKGWEPAPEADKEMLLRRLSFDLTGLPPTIEEIDAFLADDSPAAYEKIVDRLLSSTHYGERMAADWMDLARFADTHGYTVDRFRDMSPWRDWVIKAFNENMPYDRFVTWQLAGDLLPDPDREQILATGFNRNHQQNMEGGIVEEEFRVEYVADRTNTLGKAFLGLTLECARCHDHKYDPVSQKEYYQLFSFFNNVKEAGQISWNDATPVPTLLLTNEKVDSILQFIRTKVEARVAAINEVDESDRAVFTQWLHHRTLPAAFSQQGPDGLVAHFPLDDSDLANRLKPRQWGTMKTQMVATAPELVSAHRGRGLLMDGDAWLDLSPVGAYDRFEPFSVGLWIKIPAEMKNGVIFHKSTGAALYNWRGYHLAIKENQLEVLMAHTAPYNAIVEYADELPRDQFIHLAMTYDGSSRASGLKVYLNGQELATRIENDHLYKTILFQFAGQPEPGLQIGARWRGIGIKGAIVDDIQVFDRELNPLEARWLADTDGFWKIMKKPSAQLTASEEKALKTFYFDRLVPDRNRQLNELKKLRQEEAQALDTVQEVMVIREMERPRPTFILDRGLYDAPGAPVTAGTPESILPMPEDLPRNRLGLTQWLFHQAHPLTARVVVNRLWQQFFGKGLVLTTEDFGNQGALPSHPELLDWMAVTLMESDWDLKAMIKTIVLSATYRQSSKATEKMAREDPQNKWLARGPSRRLTAEMLRDNALSASGLLSAKIGGPSVKPYQPDGLWRINGGRYDTAKGEQLYRRSLYTFWKRTVPHPTQATFDAPARDNCTVRRQKTSTPLQALVLLNDPVYLEAARVLGQKMAEMEAPKAGIQYAFRALTGRRATTQELQLLEELRQSEYEKFKQHPAKAAGWTQAGEFTVPKDMAPALLAANAVVASTLINADATIVKR